MRAVHCEREVLLPDAGLTEDVEGVGVIEDPRIAISRYHACPDLITGLDGLSTNLEGFRGDSGCSERQRRLEAKTLLDRLRPQASILPDSAQLLVVLQQEVKCRSDAVDGGIEARSHKEREIHRQLYLAEDIRVRLSPRGQFADEVRTWGLEPIGDQRLEVVVPLLEYRISSGNPSVQVDTWGEDTPSVLHHGLHSCELLFGDVQQIHDHGGRNQQRVVADQVHFAVVRRNGRIEELLGHPARCLAHPLDCVRNDIRDQLGWVIESSDDGRDPDRGEINNTGDIVETALLLGQCGYPHYFEDAERILRCHLLPSQLRDISFIREPDNPHNEDGRRDVANRHLGAFGFPAPYGHKTLDAQHISFNMDIVGGSVGSLCEVYRQAVDTTPAGHYVHLHFDHETEAVAVESPYTRRHMRVRAKRPGPVFVRLPSWVAADAVSVEGSNERPRCHNGYLVVSSPAINRWITIQFELAEREIVLSHRTREIKMRLRGDSVAAMSNFGADLTFFPALEA